MVKKANSVPAQPAENVVVEIKQKLSTGMGNEPWYMSRRVWATVLSIIAIITFEFMPEQYDLMVTLLQMIAGGLSITSWVKPV